MTVTTGGVGEVVCVATQNVLSEFIFLSDLVVTRIGVPLQGVGVCKFIGQVEGDDCL